MEKEEFRQKYRLRVEVSGDKESWNIHKYWFKEIPNEKEIKEWPIYDEKNDSVYKFIIQPEDNFDRFARQICRYKYLKWFKAMYNAKKEFLLYALMGLGTIIIAINTYHFFTEGLHWHLLIANAVSWFFATIFAFLTNWKWVFTKRPKGVYAFFMQFFAFSTGRLFTLFIEGWMLWFFISRMGFPNMLVKYIAQFVVIFLNYYISKLLVFRKRKPKKKKD